MSLENLFANGLTSGVLSAGAFAKNSLEKMGFGSKAVTLADDGTLSFPDATAGIAAVFVEGSTEFGIVGISADGTITKMAGTTTTFVIVDPTTDVRLAIFPDGTTATTAKLINALGSAKTINVFYFSIGG